MMLLNRDDIEAHFGSVTAFDERIAAYAKAVKDHAMTVDVPAPTEHGIIERIVRQYGGKYELADDPEVIAKGQTFEQMRDTKLADVAAYRWSEQNAGVRFNGHLIGSDTGTLAVLVSYLISDNTEPLNFKINKTTFVSVSRDDVKVIVEAIRSHHQAAFDHEALKVAAIMKARSKKQLAAIEVGKNGAA